MAKVKQTALIGGRFKLGKPGGRKPTDFMGLVSTAQESIEQSEIRLPDATNPFGGTYDSIARIDRFLLNMNLREINSRNLANVLYASINEVPSAAVTGEKIFVGVGQTTSLEKMPLTITAVTDAATGLIEYEEDEDWRITGAGIEVIEGSALATAIAAALPAEFQVEVDYTTATFDEVEVLTNSGEEYYLLMEGTNAVGEKGKFNAHYWRVKFSPTQSRDVIGNEDFMGLQVTAEVLREDARATSDVKSPYAKLQIQRGLV